MKLGLCPACPYGTLDQAEDDHDLLLCNMCSFTSYITDVTDEPDTADEAAA